MQMSPAIVAEVEISQNFLLANESINIHIKNYAIFLLPVKIVRFTTVVAISI